MSRKIPAGIQIVDVVAHDLISFVFVFIILISVSSQYSMFT
jgi:hypothetical protein